MTFGKSKPYAILVFGAPMSGKTTFAEQLSTSIEAPFINYAKLAKKQKIERELFLELISQLSISKSTIIIEGMMDTEKDRTEIRTLLETAGYKPVLIWVQTDLNAIKQRMRHAYRSLDKAKAAFSKSYEHIEAPTDIEKPIVISGKHTYQTQYKNVMGRLSA